MPALNTPQFDWCRTRLPRHPQPVPPIFQPEVAAAAIVWAAYHKRREVYVGEPTVEAIIGNKVAPALLDHYLARTCYDGQQTDEPVNSNRPDNLFAPVAADPGAHGSFDIWAHGSSLQFWATTHRVWIGLAALAIGGATWEAYRVGAGDACAAICAVCDYLVRLACWQPSLLSDFLTP